jgi:ABC-type transport system involved in multi-copper enzyme maturation permease subunit
MKAKNVAMLVRKDLRMSVWVVLAGVIIWLLPMLFAYFGEWYYQDSATMQHLRRIMTMGAGVSVLMSVAVMSVIVSHILTAERMDRSAAFLAYVPFTRSESLIGKMTCSVVLTALFIGLDILLTMLMAQHYEEYHHDLLAFLTGIAAIGVLVFGGTWLAGSCVRNGAIATVIGVGMPFILWMSVVAWSAGRKTSDEEMAQVFMMVAVVLGVVLFLAGLAVFMRRRPEA